MKDYAYTVTKIPSVPYPTGGCSFNSVNRWGSDYFNRNVTKMEKNYLVERFGDEVTFFYQFSLSVGGVITAEINLFPFLSYF